MTSMVSTQKFPLSDQRPLTEVNLPRQPATSEADFDPELTLRAANYCIAKGSCAFVLAALRKLS
jgi:hypothetical protein